MESGIGGVVMWDTVLESAVEASSGILSGLTALNADPPRPFALPSIVVGETRMRLSMSDALRIVSASAQALSSGLQLSDGLRLVPCALLPLYAVPQPPPALPPRPLPPSLTGFTSSWVASLVAAEGNMALVISSHSGLLLVGICLQDALPRAVELIGALALSVDRKE